MGRAGLLYSVLVGEDMLAVALARLAQHIPSGKRAELKILVGQDRSIKDAYVNYSILPN